MIKYLQCSLVSVKSIEKSNQHAGTSPDILKLEERGVLSPLKNGGFQNYPCAKSQLGIFLFKRLPRGDPGWGLLMELPGDE